MDGACNQITNYRREFHKYAETGWKEIRTSARIVEILKNIGYTDIKYGTDAVDINAIAEPVRLSYEDRQKEINRAIAQGANEKIAQNTNGYPGVVATLDTGRSGHTYAFRFDIDALPYDEPDEEAYRPSVNGFSSVNAKSVHACGHDGHTAIGLGLAEMLINNIDKFNGKVKLIFQPAEETFSGAESIVSKGHLDDVDVFIAVHLSLSYNNSPLPSNSIACGCNDFLSDRQLDVYFEGKAAHPCGASQEGKNALLAACTCALNLHSIAPHEEGLFRINVGEIHAGVCANTIAPNAMLRIEYRGENNNIAEYGNRRVTKIIDAAAEMYELQYKIVDYGEVPTSKSDDSLMKIIGEAAGQMPFFEKIYYEGNVGGTDDAAVMMKKVHGNGGVASYIGLGTNAECPLHNERFDFDEDVLTAGAELLFRTVVNMSHTVEIN